MVVIFAVPVRRCRIRSFFKDNPKMEVRNGGKHINRDWQSY
jgi:hypothetical protein